MNRIFLDFQGEDKGPLIIIIAAMHGNEVAGVQALEKLKLYFTKTNKSTPKISITKGRIVGIIGNLKAFIRQVRYIDTDLNRIWYSERFENTENNSADTAEYKEALEIHHLLNKIQHEAPYTQKFLLDLHTTSAEGFFAICTESMESEEMAMHLHAPVVKGLLRDVKGSLLQYFDQKIGADRIISLAFEAGQHQDPKAVDRMIGVMLHLMEYLNILGDPISPSDYYQWLEGESNTFPKEVEVIYSYKIKDDEVWEMLPGFKNFMPVKKNQPLAVNQYGSIVSPFDGLILMPRYQPLGKDGFFIVKTIIN